MSVALDHALGNAATNSTTPRAVLALANAVPFGDVVIAYGEASYDGLGGAVIDFEDSRQNSWMTLAQGSWTNNSFAARVSATVVRNSLAVGDKITADANSSEADLGAASFTGLRSIEPYAVAVTGDTRSAPQTLTTSASVNKGDLVIGWWGFSGSFSQSSLGAPWVKLPSHEESNSYSTGAHFLIPTADGPVTYAPQVNSDGVVLMVLALRARNFNPTMLV